MHGNYLLSSESEEGKPLLNTQKNEFVGFLVSYKICLCFSCENSRIVSLTPIGTVSYHDS